jgi:hypothetical protein
VFASGAVLIPDDYPQFLAGKQKRAEASGFEVSPQDLHPAMFGFQRDATGWALRMGTAALFEECGLGKTFQELEWARIVAAHSGRKVIIFTYLGVGWQFVEQAELFGISARYCRSQAEADAAPERIIIANYAMLGAFDASCFAGVVLDESSLLKNFTGKTKNALLKAFHGTPFRLCGTATPAPNDHLELGNHAEFLGIMSSNEMISRWFVNDSMKAGGYRLARHAEKDFWQWVASWAVCISRPSDIGHSDEGFILPELHIHEHVVDVDYARAHAQGKLIPDGTVSATAMWQEKRATLQLRCEAAAARVAEKPDEYWIVWCETNDESALLKRMLPHAVEVRGSDPLKVKEERLGAFSRGSEQIMITKLGIAGFGLNWQHCRNQVYPSGTFSYERVYQGLRRSWRYGVQGDVNAHMIYAESEGNIIQSFRAKQAAHREMQERMNEAMRTSGLGGVAGRRATKRVEVEVARGRDWTLYLGDCVEVLYRYLERLSVDLAVYSPPFAGLYIYSDGEADMGNSADNEEFFRHYGYLMPALNQSLKDGAGVAVHCKDLPLYLGRDGAMGLQDFPGGLIHSHEAAGMYLERWITIWKDPVIEMKRTNNAGLLWSSAFCERAERARQGMADYVLVFRKAKRRPTSQHTPKEPIARSVVERLVDLWTNPGEEVLSPFHALAKGSQAGLIIVDGAPLPQNHWFPGIKDRLMDGRNLVIRVHEAGQMHGLIARLAESRLVFHSRVALTDGTWLVVFRKWVDEMPIDTHVKHDLRAGEHQFVGSDAPIYWDSDRDYSIQVWQRYASPVWYDLEGLPAEHPDIWFDIQQTNVLNNQIAREQDDEKHICPLQLDLIRRLIKQLTKEGELVLSPFAGIGSEGVEAVKARRRFVGAELKRAYWRVAQSYLEQAEIEASQIDLFTAMGVAV